MPNHVDSDFYVTGNSENLSEFLDFARVGENLIDANKFVPYPDKFLEMDKVAEIARNKEPPDYSVKNGFNSGGYEWRCKNWGTKWGIYDCELVIESLVQKNGKLQYRFNTAWSPPLPLIKAMSDMFPGLIFKLCYFEAGMGFKGVYIAEGGEVIKNVESKYSGRRGG